MDIRKRLLILASACVPTILAATISQADSGAYPDKPVTIISDASAGSTPDVVARFVAEGLAKQLGQQVLVVDHPGGNSSIAARIAEKADADGYTLYMPSLSSFVAREGVAPDIPPQVPRDFATIGFTAENPMFIAVAPGLGVKALPQLIDLAKKRPGRISSAVTGVGRLTDLTGELLHMQAGIKLLTVPYVGGPAHALADVTGGRVDMIIEGYSGIAAAVEAGAVKVIAVAARARLPEFPNIPTVAETLPGFSATGWQILVAPLHTPDPILAKLSEELSRVVGGAAFKASLAKLGSYSRPMSSAETIAFVHDEQQKWKPAVNRIAAR